MQLSTFATQSALTGPAVRRGRCLLIEVKLTQRGRCWDSRF
jgi:hypothetical protein